MNSVYKKECWLALVAFAVVTLMTHIYPVYFLFPGLTEMTLFGWPAHYLMTIVVGWLVMIPLYWIYIIVSEKIDDEIRETSAADSTATDAYGGKAGAPAQAGGR
jgi:putative solute:sodium symporter small subunit